MTVSISLVTVGTLMGLSIFSNSQGIPEPHIFMEILTHLHLKNMKSLELNKKHKNYSKK